MTIGYIIRWPPFPAINLKITESDKFTMSHGENHYRRKQKGSGLVRNTNFPKRAWITVVLFGLRLKLLKVGPKVLQIRFVLPVDYIRP